jgi:hypothetical protein
MAAALIRGKTVALNQTSSKLSGKAHHPPQSIANFLENFHPFIRNCKYFHKFSSISLLKPPQISSKQQLAKAFSTRKCF